MGRVVVQKPSAAYQAWRTQIDTQTQRIMNRPGFHVGAAVAVVIGGSIFGPIWATGTIKKSKHNQLYISVTAKNNTITHTARRLDIEQNVWLLKPTKED